jgi:hypothetical protein
LAWLFTTPWWVPAALATMLTFFLIWLSWPPRQAETKSIEPLTAPDGAIEGGDVPRFEGIVSDPPPFDPKRLWVGAMGVDTSKLEGELILEIWANCFNGTGHPIFIHRVRGVIAASEKSDGTATQLGDLPPPVLGDNKHYERVEPYHDIHVRFEQRVSMEIANKILEVSEKANVSLDLERLEIIVCSHNDPKQTARMPVWDAIRLHRSSGDIRANKIHVLRVKEAIGITVRSGVSL